MPLPMLIRVHTDLSRQAPSPLCLSYPSHLQISSRSHRCQATAVFRHCKYCGCGGYCSRRCEIRRRPRTIANLRERSRNFSAGTRTEIRTEKLLHRASKTVQVATAALAADPPISRPRWAGWYLYPLCVSVSLCFVEHLFLTLCFIKISKQQSDSIARPSL